MKKAIAFEMLIFIAAWFVMSPDVLKDNTYVFGLIGNYDLIRGNAHWVLLGAAVLSALNIWIWWPKSQSVTPNEKPAEVKEEPKAEEAKAEDPVVPKMD